MDMELMEPDPDEFMMGISPEQIEFMHRMGLINYQLHRTREEVEASQQALPPLMNSTQGSQIGLHEQLNAIRIVEASLGRTSAVEHFTNILTRFPPTRNRVQAHLNKETHLLEKINDYSQRLNAMRQNIICMSMEMTLPSEEQIQTLSAQHYEDSGTLKELKNTVLENRQEFAKIMSEAESLWEKVEAELEILERIYPLK